MALKLKSDPVPIQEEANGDLRVGGTRVLLDLVVNAFEDGATPETIVQRYTTLHLRDVYAVIAYYLRHRPEIEEYLRERERRADDVMEQIQRTERDLGDIRRRLVSQAGR